LPIKLISTDFDGTIFAEYEDPPISEKLQAVIGDLQSRGARWVINTGRDMTSLMIALSDPGITVRPDYLVLVEREIHERNGVRYVGLQDWNSECAQAHRSLFQRVRPDLPRLTEWVNARFRATVYEDPYSPFCFIAGNSGDAELIHEYLDGYCREIPNLVVVRNDIYARFSHTAYNKGTALAEICRRLGVNRAHVFAAGDHLNDLPMLSRAYAEWIVAPQNAIEPVKAAVRNQRGFVSDFAHGDGIADALRRFMNTSHGETR